MSTVNEEDMALTEAVYLLGAAKASIAALRGKHSVTALELEIQKFLDSIDKQEADRPDYADIHEDDDPFS